MPDAADSSQAHFPVHSLISGPSEERRVVAPFLPRNPSTIDTIPFRSTYIFSSFFFVVTSEYSCVVAAKAAIKQVPRDGFVNILLVCPSFFFLCPAYKYFLSADSTFQR